MGQVAQLVDGRSDLPPSMVDASRNLRVRAQSTFDQGELDRQRDQVFGEPPSSLMITDAPEIALLAFRIQLTAISALALTGVGLIVVRRRGEGHSLRRPLALLVYSFSLSLVMMAFLLVTAA